MVKESLIGNCNRINRKGKSINIIGIFVIKAAFPDAGPIRMVAVITHSFYEVLYRCTE